MTRTAAARRSADIALAAELRAAITDAKARAAVYVTDEKARRGSKGLTVYVSPAPYEVAWLREMITQIADRLDPDSAGNDR